MESDIQNEVIVSGVVVQIEEEILVYVGNLEYQTDLNVGEFLEGNSGEAAFVVVVDFLDEIPQWALKQEVSFTGQVKEFYEASGEILELVFKKAIDN